MDQAHTLHRRQRFATTFCDLKNRRVFDISPGRSEAELASYLRSLQGRDRVRVVCIDLSNTYRAIVRRWFPRAKIVADRFHAIRVVGLHLLKPARRPAAHRRRPAGIVGRNNSVGISRGFTGGITPPVPAGQSI